MRFPSTRQSAVFAAQSDDADERRLGLDALVDAYWKPVYKFVRLKWSCSAEDAADFTQGFFTRAIEKDFFRSYDLEKGSFRTFLRTCLEAYVSNERKSAGREKRGGGVNLLSLDFASAEGELREHPPAPGSNPEEWFIQEWVRGMFSLALEDLRELADARGKQAHVRMFERYDLEQEATYDQLASEFKVPSTTVTNHLAWARREFRRLLLLRLRGISGSESEYRADSKLLLR